MTQADAMYQELIRLESDELCQRLQNVVDSTKLSPSDREGLRYLIEKMERGSNHHMRARSMRLLLYYHTHEAHWDER